MERAIERGEFDIYYQPQIDSSNNIVSYEALCRWEKASPVEFFQTAKIEGLILKLAKYIAKTISLDLQKYPQLTMVSVNVSPIELKNDNHLLEILDILRYKDRYKFEATEDAAFVDAAIVNIEWIKKKGISFGLDDFGKAHNANLANLLTIQPDFIKFDRTLIDACNKHIGRKLCEKLVDFLQNDMGILTIAEGIETKEQLNLIKEIGFKRFQGYYIGKPQPPEVLFK